MPREGGAQRTLNAPNLRDMELLQWVADFMADMLDAPAIAVAGSSVADEGAGQGSGQGAGKPKKRRVISASE